MRRMMIWSVKFVTLLATCAVAADGDKTAVCLPVAKAAWDAMVQVYDPVLAGKPKYEAAKRDSSDILLRFVDQMENADKCAEAIALFGPDGIKAMMLKTSRDDLAAGKRPHIFD